MMGASQQTLSLDMRKKSLLPVLCDWVWAKNVNPEENQMWTITNLGFILFSESATFMVDFRGNQYFSYFLLNI